MAQVGYVDELGRAIVRVEVRGAKGSWRWMSLEVDTGAQPMVLTSLDWIVELDLPNETGGILTLADGRKEMARFAMLEVRWQDRVLVANEFAAEGDSSNRHYLAPDRRGRGVNGLLGRELMENCRLTIDYRRRTVAIEPSEGLSQ